MKEEEKIEEGKVWRVVRMERWMLMVDVDEGTENFVG
jgi:hypothetical protein